MTFDKFVAVVVVVLVACGGSDPGSRSRASSDITEAEGTTEYPLTFDNCGEEVTFDEPPSRVLILNGTSVGEVEAFVMLGLQDRILANAQSYGVSDDPGMVGRIAAIPTGGLEVNDNFDVPAEQVLSLQPDLVVSTWSGGFDTDQGFASRDELADAGIASLVNPVNCAAGKPDASATEREALGGMSVESSFDFVRLLGRIFDVPQRADQLVAELSDRIDTVERRVDAQDPKTVLLVYPGMSMMNANGLPAVMTGGIYDDVIRRAGGVNAFEGLSADDASAIGEEELARADVDVLAVGLFTPDEDAETEARHLFEQFPEWDASRTETYTAVADGPYLGPLNAWAIEKIARVTHPDAF
jgi:iron complex transport system substrate-binding protein